MSRAYRWAIEWGRFNKASVHGRERGMDRVCDCRCYYHKDMPARVKWPWDMARTYLGTSLASVGMPRKALISCFQVIYMRVQEWWRGGTCQRKSNRCEIDVVQIASREAGSIEDGFPGFTTWRCRGRLRSPCDNISQPLIWSVEFCICCSNNIAMYSIPIVYIDIYM
jgi:hypothetical protein